ncbi:MAG: tyrosine-type recombinase/integrase [Candidatus Omnitrophica bacterium]|nr:tyrosine-type recombinase/integrase [Candidatus Omnitrophota bacterium]
MSLPDKNDLIGTRDFCVMSLLYSSMMRPKEIFSLKLKDIDFRLKQILVRRPKNRKDRIVHIDTYTVFFIKKYIKDVRPWLLKSKQSDNLFISATGTDLNRSAFAAHFSRRYRPVIKEKFQKDVTAYTFRHSSATHWLDSGAKKKKDILPYVQRQLGHESLESTAIYTHIAIEPLRQMFKQYHPRELDLKKLHKIPSPDDIISPLEDDKDSK